jgi:hypothetical protein
MTTPNDHRPTIPQPEDAPSVTAPTQTVERPRRGGGTRWGIALVAVALIIGATAATLFLLSGSSTPSTVSRYVPAGSYVYVEARLDPPGDQRQGLATFMAHFPGFDDQSIFDQKIDEALDRITTEGSKGEVTYTRDLKPWIGDSVAVAATGLPTDPESPEASPFVMILAVKDANAAKAWLGSKEQGATTTETYKGVEIKLSTEPKFDATIRPAYAVLGDVVLAGDLESVKAAIDTGGASTFAASDRYRQARAAIEGDQAGFFVFDFSALLQGLKDRPEFQSLPAEQLAKVPAWMAGGLRFESDAVVVQTALPKVEGLPPASDKVSELAPRLPGNTVVAIEGRQIGEYIQTFIDNLKANPEAKAAFESFEQQAALVGGLESFYSWIGDGALVVTGSGSEFQGGLVVKPTDEAALNAKLLSLKNLFALAGGSTGITLTDEPYGDGTIIKIGLGDVGGEISEELETIALTHQRGLFVIGVGDGFVKSVIDTTTGSLADQSRYKATIDRVGSANAGQAYVDLAALLAGASTMVPEGERATFEREYRPYLEPFSAVAAAGHSGDPIRSKSIVTVQ